MENIGIYDMYCLINIDLYICAIFECTNRWSRDLSEQIVQKFQVISPSAKFKYMYF